MNLSVEDRDAIAEYRIKKANLTLSAIYKVRPLEVWGMIVSQMYFALYYSLSALLIHDGHVTYKPSEVKSQIKQFYVKTGKLSKEDLFLFVQIATLRQDSDYHDFIDANKNDVDFFLPKVEELVEKMASLIK